MEQSQVEKIKLSIQNLRSKKSKLYFFVHDTKGNAKASIKYIYDLALALKNEGFNAIILHEKSDYTGVGSWLGENYMTELTHQTIEGQNLEIAPEDFLVVPEIFSFMMDQVKNLPCGKIVLTQSYAYMLETLQPGQTWNQFGFLKTITTSEIQKEQIAKVMRGQSYDILEPVISDLFVKRELPPLPIIGVHTREQSDTINLIKTFYLRFPQYRWFTFRDLRGLSQEEFANAISECYVSVWMDRESAYGTFPLESMKVGVPVIGLTPNLIPEWMNETNGIWIKDQLLLPEVIADWTQNWLEDNISPEIYASMEETVSKLPSQETFNNKAVELFSQYLDMRAQAMEEQISKFAE
jgi:glycosyltransferase involved in cell wall biosynthesis